MTQEPKNAASGRKKTPATAAKADAEQAAFLHHYQSAVQLLQQGKFEKAKIALEALLPTAPKEMRERCQMYLNAAIRQLQAQSLSFLTLEEQYDYAVSLLNQSYFEEAREQLQAIVQKHSGDDFAYYGLAILDSLAVRSSDCLMNLATAIELNPANRIQARTDSDFQGMSDDPRFTELLYPEVA